MMSDVQRPNILMVVLDSCRADVFWDLLEEGKLDNINTISDGGTRFTDAMSVAPWTIPSHGSLFTGLYPSEHGTSATSRTFDPPTKPLAEHLSANGYRTIGLSANPWVTPGFDFDRGFDHFLTVYEYFWGGEPVDDLRAKDSRTEQLRELIQRVGPVTAVKTLSNIVYEKTLSQRVDSGAKHLTTKAVSAIERTEEDPFFLFLNYMEPHLDYNPPSDLASEELPQGVDLDQALDVNQDPWTYIAGSLSMTEEDFDILESLYRAEIRYVDHQIGRLLQQLEDEGRLDETCVVILGDHGENIGDHGLMDHQYSVHQTLLHVPLIIRHPKLTSPSIDKVVETRHLYGTLLDVAGVDGNLSRKSLIDWQGSEWVLAEYPDTQPTMDDLRNHVTEFDKSAEKYDRALRSVRKGRWKLIEGSDGAQELFDLATDPKEQNPITDPSIVSELEDKLDETMGEFRRPSDNDRSDVSEAVQDKLEELGYL